MYLRSAVALSMMIASTCSPDDARAATLAEISGNVLVNTGTGGFRLGTLSEFLRPGTRISAPPNGQAKVSFDDFCVVVVKPGAVYTVRERSPCAEGLPTQYGEMLPQDYALVGGAAIIGFGVYLATRPASP